MTHTSPPTRWFSLSVLCVLLAAPAWANNTAQTLPFTQNWTNAGLITVTDNWSGVPGIIGYRGDGLATSTAIDPQTVVADGTSTPQNVIINLTNPDTNNSGGIGEFAIANPVVAFQGSGTAQAPFLLLHLDTRGFNNVTVAYTLRDIDGSVDNSAQPVALQFRVGSTGNFTNLTAGFVADASTGPSLATASNSVSVVLPASASNQALVQVRIITTNAVGNDEWIGVDDISVTGTNVALSGVGAATPSTVAAGGSSLLTVAVTPGNPPTSTGIAVSTDLTAISGSATQAFVDDGTGGDVTAGDGIYSFNAVTTAGTTAGLKSLPVSITDAQMRSASATITLTVQVPSPPTGVASVNPATLNIGEQTLLTVTVTPGTVPTSTGLSVTADLTPIGGSATQALFDNGTNGDTTSGDNTFSFTATVPLATSSGAKTLTASITDTQMRTGAASTTLTVRTPTNPALVASATPASVLVGGPTLLTARVTAGTNPTSTGVTAAADLTALGGSATQALFDDGTNGDVTSGDGVFSFLTSVAGAITPGSKSVSVWTADAQGRGAVTTTSLTVSYGDGPGGVGAATPNAMLPGAGTLLTVTVSPGVSPASTGLTVVADLTDIGGSATALLDDGTGGDLTAGDLVFSLQTIVAVGTSAGAKTLPVLLSDTQSRSNTASISLTVQAPTSPSGVASVNPATLNISEQTLLTVTVTPGTFPTSTTVGVTADLTPIGGSATQALFDDGTHGDAVSGDDIFSFTATLPLTVTSGAKTLTASISDAQARTGTASTTLTVRTPTNPSLVATATPASVLVGGQTLLTATVTAGTNPTSTGLAVAGDLTSLGGSATQALFDDGTNGDVTSGDGVFSFLASIAGSTTTGSKSLSVSVRDAQDRGAVTTASLTVGYGSGPAGVGLASPSSLLPSANTLLTVTVTPGVSPASTAVTVVADLTSIGGAATATLFDDGTNGDVTSGDLVFSRQTTVAAGTAGGAKTLSALISDGQARTGSTSIGLTVLAPTNPVGVGLATPATVQAGAQTLLTVAVTPGTNPTSSSLTVSVDLTSLGGSATQAMKDDGTGGDAVSGDGTFSFNTTVPLAASLGARTLTASIADGQARTASANISLTVTAPPTSPAAVAAANPASLPPGGTTLLTVTVTLGTNPTSTALAVSADLSAIGGSSTQAFLDDGALGDVTSGDHVFSFRALVAGATSIGAKSMPVSVADGQSRTATTTLSLSVSPSATSPVATGTATPSSVLAGGVSLIAVTVTPGANPTSTGLTATVDLQSVGGAAAQPLLDDGAGGDVSAGDGIFSYRVTVSGTASVGIKALPVAVADAQARTAVATVGLTVIPPATDPAAVAAANPSTVLPGGSTLLTVTVTPGTAPTSTGLTVAGNLSALGGSATQAFRDDGVMGDVTAADNVFSFDATVPSATPPATIGLTFTVSDAQARSATASLSLIVSAPPATCGNSVVEGNEQCDDGNTAAGDCCSALCAFEAATTVCRAAGGTCDVAETCTGDSAACPADTRSTGVCRPAAGVCDLAESCDGVANACPTDVFSTAVCRAASQVCDAAEVCAGFGVECPADGNAPDQWTCGENLACNAGACVPVKNVDGGVGCGCMAGSGNPATLLLGLAMLGLMFRSRRRAR